MPDSAEAALPVRIGKSAGRGVDSVFNSGAPRSMKMGTIRSPWRYDGEACCASQLVMLRQPAILYYVSRRDLADGEDHGLATGL